MRTPSASSRRQKSSASATPKTTMFVSTSEGSSSIPGTPARPSARRRARAIVPEALDVVIERVEGRGGDYSGLAQGPTEHLFPPPGLRDEVIGAGQTGADRRSQALAEVDPGRVEGRRPLTGSHPAGRYGIQQPGAVEVRAEFVSAGDLEHASHPLLGPDRAAGEVGGLLDADEARARRIAVVGGMSPDRRVQRRAGEGAPIPVEHREHGTREHRRPARLIFDRMRPPAQEDLVAAWPHMRADRDLVAHRPGWQEDGRLLAEE